MDVDELRVLEWLQGRKRGHPALQLGIGDDMAVVNVGSELILLSSDMLLDGVHFDTKRDSMSQIGRKVVACALSDCAAMAVCPIAATVSVALSRDITLSGVKELYRGMEALADAFDLAIAGGDTTRWGHPLAVDVSVAARPYEGIRPVTRSGAKPGDTLYVTGPLGGSLSGRHQAFTPRVREARILASALGARLHAMIDISDGLALDLWRVCQASKVGATLDERDLDPVISDDAKRAAARDDRTPLEHALSDGEDFELLLAVGGSPNDPQVPLHRIGEVTPDRLLMRRATGRIEPLEPKGYVHGL